MTRTTTFKLAGIGLALALGGITAPSFAQTDYSQPNYPETMTSPSEIQQSPDAPAPRGYEDRTWSSESRGAQGPVGTEARMATSDMPADYTNTSPLANDIRLHQVQPNWTEITWYRDAFNNNLLERSKSNRHRR